jgi:flavin-dependent thymidylate synthase
MPPFESPFANVTKLVWITPDAEQIIEHCARVSNPKAQDKVDTTGKLLRYLVTHKHWSPFEMASACVEITTTRDISAQILRHRSFSFQEFSQRYASTVDGLGDWRYRISVGKTKRIVNQATMTFLGKLLKLSIGVSLLPLKTSNTSTKRC